MRTTIHLPDDLLIEAKKYAAETRSTLTALFEDALRQRLRSAAPKRSHSPVRLPTFRGDGLLPGVDLDDSAALADLMEGVDAAARR
jgi:hypothetical protein